MNKDQIKWLIIGAATLATGGLAVGGYFGVRALVRRHNAKKAVAETADAEPVNNESAN